MVVKSVGVETESRESESSALRREGSEPESMEPECNVAEACQYFKLKCPRTRTKDQPVLPNMSAVVTWLLVPVCY